MANTNSGGGSHGWDSTGAWGDVMAALPVATYRNTPEVAGAWPDPSWPEPEASPHTPFPSGRFARQIEDVSRWWTLGEAVTNGMIVVVSGTGLPGKEWLNGQHEHELAVVGSVLNMSRDDLSNAFVQILPDRSDFRVPMQYLVPCSPSVGDWCVVMTGRRKGLKAPFCGEDNRGKAYLRVEVNEIELFEYSYVAACERT